MIKAWWVWASAHRDGVLLGYRHFQRSDACFCGIFPLVETDQRDTSINLDACMHYCATHVFGSRRATEQSRYKLLKVTKRTTDKPNEVCGAAFALSFVLWREVCERCSIHFPVVVMG